MSIEEKIKLWVVLDNKYKKYNEEMKKIRNEKTSLTDYMINYFEEKNMKFPNINISDGKLNLSQVNIANPISVKFLEECFNEYFENKSETKELINFIKSKRVYNKNQYLRRVYNKEENDE